MNFNPLNAELNPICHLLALLGGATIVVVNRLRVKLRKVILLFNQEEHRLQVFENRVLRRDEVTGEWRRLYN
jgi:hypothetical protein